MGVYTEAVQKLYVAYFSRPADAAGLTYWENVVAANKGSTTAVSAAFATSAEYKAAYAGLDAYAVVNKVYMNLFGRVAEPAGLQYWGQLLLTGKITVDNVVTTVAAGALTTDLVAYNSKVAGATAFTAALDTTAEILGYANPAANAGAANFIAGITDAATLAAAIVPATLDATILAITTPQPVGTTFSLTSGPDMMTGTGVNDTFNATGVTLSTFDSINGGAGNDVLNIVDVLTAPGTAFPANASGATVAGVETVSVLTTGGATINSTSFSGTTKLNVTAAGTAAVSATAAATTDVFVSSANALGAGTPGITVVGGKAISVVSSGAAAGDVSIIGSGLTAATVSGGANVVVDNTKAGSGLGSTLTSATVSGATGSIALKGAALTNVGLSNIVQASAVTVTNATAGHALNLNLSSVGYDVAGAAVVVSVTDTAATSVNVNTAIKSNVAVVGTAIATATLTGSDLVLNAAGATALTSVAGAAATGAITLTGLANTVNTINTGIGADTFTVTTATSSTVNATVSSGAGNDKITLATTGAGTVTVATGDGNDTLTIASRSGTEALVLDLGAGNDVLLVTGVAEIGAGDKIDAGAGVDTLSLNLVGATNVKAFSNFDIFDAAALGRALDIEILSTQNSVTEIIASGDVGVGAELINLGAGVSVRATTADMTTNVLKLSQKAPGAITVGLDIDESAAADTAIDTAVARFDAANATTINAVFSSDFKAGIAGEFTTGDNVATMILSSATATAVTVASGGTLANNVLNLTGAATKSVAVTGASALALNVTSAALTTVDASAHTGGLTFATGNLKDLGTVTIGSGVDFITVSGTSTTTALGFESIAGMEKAAKVSVSAVAADATAKAAAIADADVMVIAGGVVADSLVGNFTNGTIANGVLTFIGSGPTTLTEAFVFANEAAEGLGETVVFEYIGSSYVFVQGATDLAVKLVGVTGITNIVEGTGAGVDTFFIV